MDLRTTELMLQINLRMHHQKLEWAKPSLKNSMRENLPEKQWTFVWQVENAPIRRAPNKPSNHISPPTEWLPRMVLSDQKKPLSSKPDGWFSSCSYIWSTALLILLLYTSKVAYLLKRDGPQVWRGNLLSAPLLWRVCRSTWTFSPELSKQSFLKPHSNYQRNSRV